MTKETVTIAHNAVIAKLHQPSRDVKLEVQRLLSYAVSGAEQSELFKTHRWDGRSSFLDFRQGTFPAGFVHYVTAGLKRAGYLVNILRKPLPEPLGPQKPVVDSFGEDPRYDYQPEVYERLVKYGSFIAQVATGGGKSRIARMCYARINRPTLFLTTRSILMYQMKDAFEALGVSVSVFGDGQFGHTIIDEHGNERQALRKMSVGMVQTFVSKLQLPDPRDPIEKQQKQAQERAKTIALLSKFEFVIGEEAHEAGGNSYYEILQHCKNAHYRLALTATPFMKDDEESNMRLHAAFGPVGIRVPEKLLIDRGILAKPYFKVVQLKERPRKLYKTTAWQSAYRIGITENDERNGAILSEARRAVRYGLPVMILVQHKAHGVELLSRLRAEGITSQFIFGENDQAERQEALNELRDGSTQVLIGSTILDVGVDVPAVGMVILAGGGKAEVALRQRIGRGLRAKKVGPNVCFVVDFSDQFNEHLLRHAQQRQEIIRSTPGFGENILPPGAEFDYEGFGLAKRVA
jgi:superfamily II DNA or RNA helicase